MSKYKIPNSNIRKYSRCMRVTAMLLAAGMALSNMFPVSAKTAVKISLSRHRVRIQEGEKAIVRINNTGKKKIRIKAANRKTVSARLAGKKITITAKKKGKTTVFVSAGKMKTASIKVTVTKKPSEDKPAAKPDSGTKDTDTDPGTESPDVLAEGVTTVRSAADIKRTSNGHLYDWNWASVPESRLFSMKDGTLIRVENAEDYFVVECFESSYKSKWVKTIKRALPLWGAVGYDGADFYVVTGQKNMEEDKSKAVFNITKYNEKWKKTGEVSVGDCYTTIPFDAGSCSLAFYKDTMYIKTCRQMYQSEDGLHHQSNITIVLNKEKMQVEDYPRGLTDYEKEDIYNYGYVSHSFHQIARMDGDDLTSVDHGDAYPRSIVLNNMGKGEKGKTITDIRYSENEYLGKYVSGITYRDQGVGAGKAYDLLKIPGGTGENVTGATLGDLQVSDHAYLVCGTSVDQDKAAKDPGLQSEKKQNVYLLAMDKETKAVKLSWVTKYESSEDLVNPYLTRLSKNRYMLIWQYKNAVYYREVDGTGRFLTEQNMKKEYRLSDCEPVAVNGKVQWFYTNKKKISFYSIPYEKQEIQLKQPVGIHTGMKENDIKISWEPVTDADGYEIYRSEDGGEFQKIGEQTELSRPGEKATYTDENCRQHVSYAYRIRAYCLDEQGQKKEGPFNAEDVCQICVKKVAVSEVAAVTDGIKISWDQDKDASGYVIYRWEFNSSLEWNYMFYFEKMQKYQVIEAGDITSFVDTNVKSFWMYAYTVAEVYQDTEGDHGSAERYESAGFRRN